MPVSPSADEASRGIFGKFKMKFIDLSHSISKQTPVYPGDPKIKITRAGVLEKNGYQDHVVCIGTHVGTHIDAPAHMIAGGKNLDQIPINNFMGRAIYIKVNNEFKFEEVRKVNIQEGDIVLFHTGRGEHYREPDYFEDYPVMSEKIADYLVEKGVKMVGVDVCSVDIEESFPIHKTLLKNGVSIIENLTNLALLAGKKFKVYAFPIKLQIDGAPVRVVAEIE